MRKIRQLLSGLVAFAVVTATAVLTPTGIASAAPADPPQCVGNTSILGWEGETDNAASGTMTDGTVTATYTSAVTFAPPPGDMESSSVGVSQTGTFGGDTGYFRLQVDWLTTSEPPASHYHPLSQLELTFDKPVIFSTAILDVDQVAWTDHVRVWADFNGVDVPVNATQVNPAYTQLEPTLPLEYSGTADAATNEDFANIDITTSSPINRIVIDHWAGDIGVSGQNFTGNQVIGLGDIQLCTNDRTISGEVYADANVNGVNDGDTELAGFTVELFDEHGNLVDTTTTAVDGSYQFTDLPPYDGWEVVLSDQGYGVSGDPDAVLDGRSEPDTLAGDSLNNDFGLAARTDIVVVKSPDSQTIDPGADAEFTITVVNVGDLPLRNTAVIDAETPACATTIAGDFAPGATHTYTCTATNVTAGFTNIARAGGDPVFATSGGEVILDAVNDIDTAVVALANPTPSLNIIKSPDAQTVIAGATAEFTITVVNDGELDLTGVAVTDALTPSCASTIGALAAGAYTTYTCTATNVTAGFTNVAQVSGQPVDANGTATGPVITDDDNAVVNLSNAVVPTPDIAIFKSPDTQTVLPGADAEFTITVVNNGDYELTNVAVTDALTPACDTTVASLAEGASHTYTCTATSVDSDFTNTAAVSGQPVDGGGTPVGSPVTDDDTAAVVVASPTPAIQIVKSPATQTVPYDSDVTFSITVVNTGELDLTGVAVTDALAPVCDNTIGALAVGEFVSYECTVTDVTAAFVNTAQVSGQPVDESGDALGAVVTDDDTAAVVLGTGAPQGDVTIVKTPDTQTVDFEDDVTFGITVINTGDLELTNVAVTDAAVPACDTTIASLAVGEIHSYDCTVSAVDANFTNTANVSAQPVDELGDPVGAAVTDSDTADVVVTAPTPSVSIAKSPDTQTVDYEDDVTFTITVVNTGELELTNVTVTDANAPACDTTVASLAVGASHTYDCTLAGVTADFTNTANVSAQPVDSGGNNVGTAVTDVDTADVVVNAPSPSIAILKSADNQTIDYGADAPFTITVVNTGDLDLTDVTITDALAPGCDATILTLDVGEVSSYDCSDTDVTADYTNSATVTAQPVDSGGVDVGGTVTDTDTANVTVLAPSPSIAIEKSPDAQVVDYGSDVTFTITVVNTGDLELTNVAIVDALATGCNATIASLPVGGTQTYDCTDADVTADYVNSATATAQPVDVNGNNFGGTVTDTDTGSVTVMAPTPSVSIAKSPDAQSVEYGSDVTFVITVVNTGDLDLNNVTVTDAATPACDTTIATLAAGATQTYECTATDVTAGFTNSATVSGQPVDVNGNNFGAPVDATDSAVVTVVAPSPSVSIAKSPDAQSVEFGADATFVITVVNTGDLDLANVTVADAATPACDTTIVSLAAGATQTYECTATNVTADFTNSATVTGQPVDVNGNNFGGTVDATDTADVTVLSPSPAITLTKSPATQTVDFDDDVTFTITVVNSGDLTLTNVAITDALAPSCAAAVVDLDPGESHTYDCVDADVQAGFTNTAVVTADPVDSNGNPAGAAVTDTDSAIVVVNAPSPSIEIFKSPDTQEIDAGTAAEFTITVVNTGTLTLAGVAVTDAAASGCANAIGTMAPGAVTTYSCVAPSTTTDYTNTANVSGQPVDGAGANVGTAVTDSDTADVTHVAASLPVPSILVIKSLDSQTVDPGEDAVFSITVVNDGETDLANVAVTDAAVPACDNTIGALAIGASVTYECTDLAVTTGYTNTAAVAGDPVDENGNPFDANDNGDLTDDAVTDTDDAAVVVSALSPSVRVEKSQDTQAVLPGGDATFTITVINDGDADLANVAVADAAAPGCDNTIGALAAGESVTYECTDAGVTAGYTNTAIATGDPLDANGDPYDANGNGNLTDDTVTDSDTAAVTITALNPSVRVEKSQDTQAVLPGGDATFTITVINDGDADLANVAVADAAAPGCDNTIGALAAGESVTYECTDAGVTAGYTNTAIATGDPLDLNGDPYDANGNGNLTDDTVTDSDTAAVTITALNPSIAIEKNQDTQAVLPGGDATFTITVINDGDADLANVAVADAAVPACDNTIGSLAAGASFTYECTDVGVTAGYTNTAIATGDPLDINGDPYDANGNGNLTDDTVTASDTAVVTIPPLTPAISIEKNQDTQTVLPGADAVFTITVVNTGQTDLVGVAVTDAAAPGCDNSTIGSLAVGESFTYECTDADVTAAYTNTAIVTGDPVDVNGDPYDADGNGNLTDDTVTASDTADVVIAALTPAISIEKNQDTQTVLPGGAAMFTITVVNTGQTDLTNVAVVDALAPECDTSIGDLAVGAAVTYECTQANVTEGYTNTAVATGDPVDVDGNPYDADGNGNLTDDTVTGTDTAAVAVATLTPSIQVEKTHDNQTVQPGGAAEFTITVVNTGETDLVNVAVVDALAPECNTSIGNLARGEVIVYTCTEANVTEGYTNTAVATGDPVDASGNPYDADGNGDPTDDTVTDSDDAVVAVATLTPSVRVEKGHDSQTVEPGRAPTFTITVINDGETDLTGVAVVDALAPECTSSLGDLAVGESVTFQCTGSPVTEGYTNTAVVTAEPLDVNGNPYDANGNGNLTDDTVTDTDDAAVAVATPVPSIQIDKTQDTQTVMPGEDAVFTITVVNTGETDLVNVEVVDALAPACDNTIGDLARGEAVVYTCTDTGLTAGYTNVASVTGDPVDRNGDAYDANGNGNLTDDAVSDTDDAVVVVANPVPSIQVDKTQDSQTVMPGGDAVFTITVVNTGETDLVNVEVVDALAPACDRTIGDLARGEAVIYSCADLAVTEGYTNVAVASGDPVDANGNPYDADGNGNAGDDTVTDSDDAEVIVATPVPSMHVAKHHQADTVVAGGDAVFTITVVNDGETDLTDVAVVDALAPACDNTIGDLAVGEVVTYECTQTGVTEGYTNVAVGTGTPVDENGDPYDADGNGDDTDDAVTGTGDAVVEVTTLLPDVEIHKNVDHQVINAGGDAVFTITVVNTGQLDLVDVVVVDELAPACDRTIGALAVGEAVVYDCTDEAVAEGYTNVAVATGSPVDDLGAPVDVDRDGDAGNDAVEHDDDAVVEVVFNEGISFQKDVNAVAATIGDEVEWTLTVTNFGPVATTGEIVITDDLPASLTYSGFVGDGWSCSASGQMVTCSTDRSVLGGGGSLAVILLTEVTSEGPTTNSANLAIENPGGELVECECPDTATVVATEIPTPPPAPTPSLPSTGAETWRVLWIGALFIVSGVVTLAATSRKRQIT